METKKCVTPDQCKCDLKSKTCQKCQEKVCEKGVPVCKDTPNCDCAWNNWNTWTTCTKTCESGTRTRTRVHSSIRRGNGKPCEGSSNATEVCNTENCPYVCIDRNGIRYKAGETMPPQLDKCHVCYCDPLTKRAKCNPKEKSDPSLPPVRWQNWSPWTACTKECGGGVRERCRACDDPCVNLNRVDQCRIINGTDKMDQEACNSQPCKIDCKVDLEWKNGACNAKCDNVSSAAIGTMIQTRTIITRAQNGGQACAPTKRSIPCETSCKVDCSVGEWSPYGECGITCDPKDSSCSATCGKGQRKRTRPQIRSAMNGGKSDCFTEQFEACEKNCTGAATQPPCVAPKSIMKCATNRCHQTCRDLSTDKQCAPSACKEGCSCPKDTYMQNGDCVKGDDCKCVWDTNKLGPKPSSIKGDEVPPGYVVAHQCNNCTCQRGAWSCGDKVCKQDCKWNEWQKPKCNAICGMGSHTWTRSKKQEALFGGKQCEGSDTEVHECRSVNRPCCKDNSVVKSSPTECSHTCTSFYKNEVLANNCAEDCMCAPGFVMDGSKCIKKEACGNCKCGEATYDFPKCVVRTCVSNNITEHLIPIDKLPECSLNDKRIFENGGKKLRHSSECCYTASIPICHRVSTTIREVKIDEENCILQTPFITSRCTGGCDSSNQPRAQSFKSKADAKEVYDAIRMASNPALVSAFRSSVIGSCSCCMPVQVIPQPPMEVVAKCAGGKLKTIYMENSQITECGCRDTTGCTLPKPNP